MAKLDTSPLDSGASASPETIELAQELQQEHPDHHLIEWLINDREADLAYALREAHIEEKDLFRKPQLRQLCLQRYLHRPHP